MYLTESQKASILNHASFEAIIQYVIKLPCSRGVSGALYLQSAIAGVMFCLGYFLVELPLVSDVDALVLRNGNL